MNVQELEKKVVYLTEKREAARSAALKSSVSAKIEELTIKGAELSHRAKDPTAVYAERDALKDARDADVRALSEELHAVRVELRAKLSEELGQALESKTVSELELLRAQLTADRRAIKKKLRVVVDMLAKKQALVAMRDLWEKLTTEEKAALMAHFEAKK